MIEALVASFVSLFVTHFLQMYNLSKGYEKANLEFDEKKYLKGERWGIAASVGVIVLAALGWEEFVGFKPSLESYPIFIFAVVGSLGTFLFSLGMGGARKYLWRQIDEKTNKADGKDIN